LERRIEGIKVGKEKNLRKKEKERRTRKKNEGYEREKQR